jgi:hypothetical protein
MVGTKVGNYALTRLLGSGGMGSVYHAEHPEIGREVAIKVLAEDLVQSATSAERFLREARSMVRVKHPNVIEVYDFGRTERGQLYYVMELLVGRDLAEIIESEGSLSVAKVGALLEQICPALQAAHDAGVVHRDLKPANIFVLDGEPLRIKILDFGIAKLLEQPEGSSSTRTGMLLGTPHYMAPEQAAGENRRIGPATDIYALGAILYHLLAGRLPFDSEMVAVLLAQHIEKPPEPLRSVAPSVPEAVAALVDQCLAKKPERRPPSAAVFLDSYSRAMRQALRPVAAPDARDPLPRTQHDAAAPVTGPGAHDVMPATQIDDAGAPIGTDAVVATVYDEVPVATHANAPTMRADDAPGAAMPATRADDAPVADLPATRADDGPVADPTATRADDGPVADLPATRADDAPPPLRASVPQPATQADAAPRTSLSPTRADDPGPPPASARPVTHSSGVAGPGKIRLLVASMVVVLCVAGGVLLSRWLGKTPTDPHPDTDADARGSTARQPDASRSTAAAQVDASKSAATPQQDATRQPAVSKNKAPARSVATTAVPRAHTPDAGRRTTRRVRPSPPVEARTKPPVTKKNDRAAEEGWVKEDPY